MKAVTIKYKKGYECAILFSVFTTIFYTLQGSKLYSGRLKILLLIAAVMAVFAITKKTKKKITQQALLLTVFGALVSISIINTQDSRVLIALLAVGIGLAYDLKEIMMTVFITKLGTFLAVMLAGGYSHINGVALQSGVLILLYITIMEEFGKGNFFGLIGCVLSYVIFSLYTKSGSLIICGGFAILALLLKNQKFIRKLLLSEIFRFTFLILLSVNVICANLFYKKNSLVVSKILNILDVFVTHRIELASYSLKHFGVSWLGGNVEYDLQSFVSGSYFNLDSGYMWLLQGGGILLTIVFILGTIVMLTYFLKKEKYSMMVVSIAIALWAMNEDILLSIGTNFLLYYIGVALKNHESRKVKV